MNNRPPRRPNAPPLPDMSNYRPFEERAGAAPPIEQRFRPPVAPVRAGSGTARPRPRRRRRGWRILAWSIGGLGVLLAAGLGALVVFAPVGIIRDQVAREVEVQTGRTLSIAGRTSLALFPTPGLAMDDVTLSSPPAMGGEPFVKMRRLDIRIGLLSLLLSRRLEVEQLVLSEPVFNFRVDQRGRRNWDFATLAGVPTIMVAQAQPDRSTPGSAGKATDALPSELRDFLRNSTQPAEDRPAAPSDSTGRSRVATSRATPDVALRDLRIDNGTLRYRDERAGNAEEIGTLNARFAGVTLTAPLEASGSFELRGDRIDFDGRIASPKSLLQDRASRVTLALRSARAFGRYDGSLSLAAVAPLLDGKIKLETDSVRSLAGWIGVRLAPGPGLGAFALEGEVRTGPSSVALANASARLDAITATGNLSVDYPTGRPMVKADLRLGAVDLDSYCDGTSTSPPQSPQPALRIGPQVKGFVGRSGWSEAPIDISGLGLADADVRLSLASLVFHEVRIGSTQLTATLKGRVLRANIDDIRLYNGQGRGLVTLEPAPQGAAFAANMSLAGVSGLPLLKDVAGFDWLDGKARVQLAVAGAGASERAIVEALNGKAELGFVDGAIIGFNVPQMIRGLSQGRISGFNRTPTEKTDFTEAGATFQIRNGIAETKDLHAVSPMIRLTGAGNINLGQRQIDAILRPKLVGTLTGQGAPSGDLSGLELPIKIKGSWERPSISPDVDGLLKNPNQAIDTIKEIGRQLQKGNTGGLNNLLEQFKRR